jgi:hypothetical protein
VSSDAPTVPSGLVLRRPLLGVILVLLVQASVGMVVNLDVSVPVHHPGARPSNYLTGSLQSVAWAIGHGAAALAIHAALGLALVVLALAVAVLAARRAGRSVTALTSLGGLLVLGAGFNGASFLDFGHDTSSLVMALLCFAAIAAYSVALAREPFAQEAARCPRPSPGPS